MGINSSRAVEYEREIALSQEVEILSRAITRHRGQIKNGHKYKKSTRPGIDFPAGYVL